MTARPARRTVFSLRMMVRIASAPRPRHGARNSAALHAGRIVDGKAEHLKASADADERAVDNVPSAAANPRS